MAMDDFNSEYDSIFCALLDTPIFSPINIMAIKLERCKEPILLQSTTFGSLYMILY